MSFKLIRRGLIFSPDGTIAWMQSHAQVPRVLVMDGRIRIFFATRERPDEKGMFVSRIGYVDVDRQNPKQILAVSERPAFDLGDEGMFDRYGVMPGNIIPNSAGFSMFYTGWNRSSSVPYITCIGYAISDVSVSQFKRTSSHPVMSATKREPFLCNGPFIVLQGGLMHMFYSSALAWLQDDRRLESHYVIMHATSSDGGSWQRDAIACVPVLHELECQNSPTVIKLNGRFHMWFCHRHALDFRNAQRGYRLGYASSDDLINWERDDTKAQLYGRTDEWETQMQCYPGVYRIDDRILLFYCGNGFGRDGFGFAELEV